MFYTLSLEVLDWGTEKMVFPFIEIDNEDTN